MIVQSLKLKDFRNYDELDLSFSPHTNIFFGKNAQGKTNILEAVYVGGTTRSHRQAKDKDMIRFEKEEAHIGLKVEKNGISYDIDMHLKKNSAKGVAINRSPIRKAIDLYGIVHFVFFSPENLNIIKHAPSERRRFIDMELCQLDKVYASQLISYQKTLLQRNKLLKDISHQEDGEIVLSILDEQLSLYGNEIMNRRKIFVQKLNEIMYNIHKRLTGNMEEIQVLYCPGTGDVPLEEALLRNRDKDLRFQNTSVGPHRDDLVFLVNGMDVRTYGSQGQQRTAALSLKLSEIDMVRQTVRDTPVLLLDDVLSELDQSRQEYLLNSINDVQTFITCTGVDEFVNHRFRMDQIYQVSEGHVTEINDIRSQYGAGNYNSE